LVVVANDLASRVAGDRPWFVVSDLGWATGWRFVVARRLCGGVADALGWWIDPVFPLVFDCSDQHLVCENLECNGGFAGCVGLWSLSRSGLPSPLAFAVYLGDSGGISNNCSG